MKGESQKCSLEELRVARAADELIGEIGHRDEDKRERPEQIAGLSREELRIGVHSEQDGGGDKRGHAKK